MANIPRVIRQTQRFKLHGYAIVKDGHRAMTILGPKGHQVIALFTSKPEAEQTLLSYGESYEVKHFGLIELKN